MKRTVFLSLFLVMAFFRTASFAQGVKYVAVIETQINAASGVSDEISSSELEEITTEIRRIAVNMLPSGRFNVMTSETVLSMGGAVLEECAEENCVIALGSKIGADYIVRGIVSKFRQNFSLSVEIFETENGMLVASAASVRTANLDELLEKGAAACVEMYRNFLATMGQPAAPQPSAATPPPAPTPPAAAQIPAPVPAVSPPSPPIYTLTVNTKPFAGGTVQLDPNQPRYSDGAIVMAAAVPADGYRFKNWSGAALSKKDSVTAVRMNRSLTLTANY